MAVILDLWDIQLGTCSDGSRDTRASVFVTIIIHDIGQTMTTAYLFSVAPGSSVSVLILLDTEKNSVALP